MPAVVVGLDNALTRVVGIGVVGIEMGADVFRRAKVLFLIRLLICSGT